MQGCSPGKVNLITFKFLCLMMPRACKKNGSILCSSIPSYSHIDSHIYLEYSHHTTICKHVCGMLRGVAARSCSYGIYGIQRRRDRRSVQGFSGIQRWRKACVWNAAWRCCAKLLLGTLINPETARSSVCTGFLRNSAVTESRNSFMRRESQTSYTWIYIYIYIYVYIY